MGIHTGAHEAKRLGFAEADRRRRLRPRRGARSWRCGEPRVNGRSAKKIPVAGIELVDAVDIQFARDWLRVKLLPSPNGATRTASLRVHPTRIPPATCWPTGRQLNAISVWGQPGHALFTAAAPTNATASRSFRTDRVGLGDAAGFQRLTSSRPHATARRVAVAQRETATTCASPRARPPCRGNRRGSGPQRLSLSAVLQHEVDRGQHVPVVLTTPLHAKAQGDRRCARSTRSRPSGPPRFFE